MIVSLARPNCIVLCASTSSRSMIAFDGLLRLGPCKTFRRRFSRLQLPIDVTRNRLESDGCFHRAACALEAACLFAYLFICFPEFTVFTLFVSRNRSALGCLSSGLFLAHTQPFGTYGCNRRNYRNSASMALSLPVISPSVFCSDEPTDTIDLVLIS